MAEVLGIGISATTLVVQLNDALKLFAEVKGAPKKVRELISSLENLNGVMSNIKADPAYQQEEVAKRLQLLIDQIEKLSCALNKASKSPQDSPFRKATKAMRAALLSSKIDGKLAQISFDKSSLDTLLAQLNTKHLEQLIQSRSSNAERLASSPNDCIAPEVERDTCLGELGISSPKGDRERMKTERLQQCAGTCTWIIQTSQYQQWQDPGSQSRLLWVCGRAGQGKTALSIFVTEHLEAVANSRAQLLTYFFCDYKQKNQTSVSALLRGMMYQLLGKKPELIRCILPEWQIHHSSLFEPKYFESLWEIFRTMIDETNTTVYCVLDGIDELESESLKCLLSKLERLEDTVPPKLKLMVFSRDFPPRINAALSAYPKIQLYSESSTDLNFSKQIENDVKTLIRTEVNKLSRIKHYPEELKTHVFRTLQQRAHGTFLWVGLAVSFLREVDLSATEAALNDLPPGLDALYRRIIFSISKENSALIGTMLMWVALAREPLSLAQLGFALKLGPTPKLELDVVTEAKVKLSQGLLLINKGFVALVHVSLKDYLLQNDLESEDGLRPFRIDADEGNCNIAKRCIEVMNVDNFDDEIFQEMEEQGFPTTDDTDGEDNIYESVPDEPEEDIPATDNENDIYESVPDEPAKYLFERYAAFNWLYHARRSRTFGTNGSKLFSAFFDSSTSLGYLWLKCYCEDNILYSSTLELLEGDLLEHQKLTELRRGADFVAAAALGLSSLAKELLPESHSEEDRKKNSDCLTLGLWAAVDAGDTATLQLLIDLGQDVNARDRYQNTLLHTAVCDRQKEIVAALVANHADIEAKDRWGCAPLHKAWPSPDILTLLLKSGANIAAQDEYGDTVLHMAARIGNAVAVRALLEAGSDVNACNFCKQTALHKASLANIQSPYPEPMNEFKSMRDQMSQGKSILEIDLRIHAAMGGLETANVLLGAGADIEASDHKKRTPFFSAVESRNFSAVRQLREYGARIDIIDEQGKTPLHEAVTSVQPAMVLFLLEAGADPFAADNDGETPLAAAERLMKEKQLAIEEAGEETDENERYLPVMPKPDPREDLEVLKWIIIILTEVMQMQIDNHIETPSSIEPKSLEPVATHIRSGEPTEQAAVSVIDSSSRSENCALLPSPTPVKIDSGISVIDTAI
ncbi:uncharacterized protein A1O5_08993 [Cladophialophora psammophila CBS 110553]|uniref:Nephrocystin 3-like N-terminal domain-containing protein n=1 Tax=Cladophialophora psammophila CBS 110553 TaxID=1182543 RepID=W9WHM6_9EURO|nr:uncharacterized protein A1O5_08993 [Cladophialophora psammophila CBS 110553]EXJ67647.1 hypothetical protein A1O5_08993 [Cladophialophora psammophila CBS 110553]